MRFVWSRILHPIFIDSVLTILWVCPSQALEIFIVHIFKIFGLQRNVWWLITFTLLGLYPPVSENSAHDQHSESWSPLWGPNHSHCGPGPALPHHLWVTHRRRAAALVWRNLWKPAEEALLDSLQRHLLVARWNSPLVPCHSCVQCPRHQCSWFSLNRPTSKELQKLLVCSTQMNLGACQVQASRMLVKDCETGSVESTFPVLALDLLGARTPS